MTLLRLITLMLAMTASIMAQPRQWKNKEGTRAVRGDFVSRNAESVQIRRSSDFKVITLPLTMIHAEEITWLDTHHPLPGTPEATPPTPVVINSDFQTIANQIQFGDDHDQTLAKLKACPLIKNTLPETLFVRTGLDGIYRTTKQIEGVTYELYFIWDEDQRLKEFSFRSEPMNPSQFNEVILPRWKRAIEVVTSIYGKPMGTSTDPVNFSTIPKDTIHYFHVWKNPVQGSILVGIGRFEHDAYVQIHYTSNTVALKQTPKTAPTP